MGGDKQGESMNDPKIKQKEVDTTLPILSILAELRELLDDNEVYRF